MSFGIGPHDPGCECWRCESRRRVAVKRPYMRHPPCSVECRCDGNQVYALIGPASEALTGGAGGVIGFGDTLADALRHLADEIEKEVGAQ